jgi:hypothetical protein
MKLRISDPPAPRNHPNLHFQDGVFLSLVDLVPVDKTPFAPSGSVVSVLAFHPIAVYTEPLARSKVLPIPARSRSAWAACLRLFLDYEA